MKQSGVPSALTGSIVQAVKSMPMPTTSVGCDARRLERRRDGVLEDFEVVVGVLQRPFRRERTVAAGQVLVDHAVGVSMDGGGDLAPVARYRPRPRARILYRNLFQSCMMSYA